MSSERGFTLPELVTAIVVLVAALLATSLLLRPADYSVQDREAERRLAIATIAQGLVSYRDEHGGWPAGLPTEETAIGTLDDAYDLCSVLAPKHLEGIPLEPLIGMEETDKDRADVSHACTDQDAGYMSGYTIIRLADNKVRIGLVLLEAADLQITL